MKQHPNRLFRRLPRVRRDERGVTMVIWGLLIVGLLSIVAIVIDLGNARQEKRQLQNAADAAALAGANDISQNGSAAVPCATAAKYTYNNLRLGTVTASCTAGGTFDQSAGNMQITVATPYLTGPPAFDSKSLINVKACKDVPTTFARVINITKVRVCGNATARKVGITSGSGGGGGGGGGGGTTTSDPESPCTVDAFTTDGYFDKDHGPNGFPPKNTADANHSGTDPGGPTGEDKIVGATYWSTTDIDFTTNKPYFFLENTTAGTKTTYTYVADNNPTNMYIQKMVKIDNVNVPAGIFAYQVVWKVPKALPNNANYTVGVSVYDSASASFPPNGKCGKAQWTFTKGTPSSGTSPCGGTGVVEDAFLGAVYPQPGGAVTPGSEVGATYQDESPIFNVLDATDPAYNHRIQLYIDGTSIPEDTLGTPNAKGPNTVGQPNRADTPTDKFTLTSGTQKMTTNEKYSTDILWKVPTSISNGSHTITLKAWDGDNNKSGGDCGVATWTITVSGGASTNSNVMLVE